MDVSVLQVHTLLSWRVIYASFLLLQLTSLLAELLGQRILEKDLSSMCSCGSGKRQREEEERH